MKYLVIGLILISVAVFAADCQVLLVSDLVPASSNTEVEAIYHFDCTSEGYVGQITNIRFEVPDSFKDVSVKDSTGLLIPEADDPEFYKLTDKGEHSILSVNPRRSILIAPYGSQYDLTLKYTAKNVISRTDQIGYIEPKNIVIKPTFTKIVQNTKTRIESQVDTYTFILSLPDGSEIKEISQPCTVNENKFTCESTDISGLSMQWREKALPEQIAQKGWPWAIVGLKSVLGDFLGGLI
ncbi:hypothetical protein ACFLQI_02620 [Candidatus Undinarchaeota archaeon]